MYTDLRILVINSTLERLFTITSQTSLFAGLPKDYFMGDFLTVAQANANLPINGGSGRNLYVNASRLMVEPNGSSQWGKRN